MLFTSAAQTNTYLGNWMAFQAEEMTDHARNHACKRAKVE